MSKLIYVTENLIFDLQDKVDRLERENLKLRLLQKEKPQTPITPENLEAIGFEENRDEVLVFGIEVSILSENITYCGISYAEKKFSLTFGCFDEYFSKKLHFTSTEQIVEFVKCFQAKEGK